MFDNSIMEDRGPIIPMDPETREDLLNVDRKTKEDLRERHRLYINNDWELTTITTVVIESLVRVLYSQVRNNGVSILSKDYGGVLNYYDLLEIAATYKENAKAEKTGNINVKFGAGSKVDDIISDDVPEKDKENEYMEIVAAYSFPDDEDRTKSIRAVDKVARKTIFDKYNIMLPKDYMAIATSVIYLENLYKYLVQKAVLTGKPSVTINFNDIIEFHAIRKDDKLTIKLRPGMGAKLIIKSDADTEFEDDGLDD